MPPAFIPILDAKADVKADRHADPDHTDLTSDIQHSFDRELPGITINDHEPIVVLDDDASASAQPTSTGAAYLCSQGISDPATWAAFRVDAVATSDLTRLLTLRQRAHLLPQGLWLPTFDPREPERIIGLIRLSPSQNQHRFVSAPAGLAAPADLDRQSRVVLCDHPLLAMRLHERGVAGIAIVEDPTVLLPLADWFGTREVVTITTAKRGELLLPPGITPVGTGRICGKLEQASTDALALLGLDRASVRPAMEPRPLITLPLLRDLHAYAVTCVQRGEAAAAFAALGFTDPGFVAAYRIGYLPVDFRRALSDDARRALGGLLLGGAVVVPAFDEPGVVVDLLAVSSSANGHGVASLFEEPRGLIAPVVSTAFDEVLVTDVLVRAARYAADGHRNVVLLRGEADAVANVARLVKSGVTKATVRCWRKGEAFASILGAAGMAVTHVSGRDWLSDADDGNDGPSAPAVPDFAQDSINNTISADVVPLPPLVMPLPESATVEISAPADVPLLEDHDLHTQRAIFRAGDLAYVLQVPWDERALVEVGVNRGDVRHAACAVDLGLDVQRRRYATVAAEKVRVPAARIAAHLAVLHAALPGLRAAATGVRPAAPLIVHLGDAALLDSLRSPTLLPRILAALDDLGWNADDTLRQLGFLAALSRKLDEPAWLALTATDLVTASHALHAIAAATPPEDRIQVTRLTDNALLHADPDALRHKLLILDDLEKVSAGVATSLCVLRTRGAVSGTLVERDALHGGVRTRFVEAHGPVALLGAASENVDARLAGSLVEVPSDGTATNVAAGLAAERLRRTDPAIAGRAAAKMTTATAFLHGLQRLIQAHPVVLPNVDAIIIHPGSPRARLHQQTVLALASASALLHQYQREMVNGCVLATTDDLSLAQRLAGLWSAPSEGGLSRNAGQLLAALRTANRLRVTLLDCALLLPGISRSCFVRALKELVQTEYLASPSGGRGRQRVYRLLGVTTETTHTYDAQKRQVGQLANDFPTSGQLTSPAGKVG